MTSAQLEPALDTAEEALARTERSNALWWMPEAIRIKGEVLLTCKANTHPAEDHFHRSLDLAHRQGALSWELRAAASLARLLRDQGRSAEALALPRRSARARGRCGSSGNMHRPSRKNLKCANASEPLV
jgi:predicted ATPase